MLWNRKGDLTVLPTPHVAPPKRDDIDCKCDQKPAAVKDGTDAGQSRVVPARDVESLKRNATAFGVSLDTIAVHPDAATIEIFSPSADVVLVSTDEKNELSASGATAVEKGASEKPRISLPIDLLARGLSGVIFAGDSADGPDPIHYVTFGGKAGKSSSGAGIQSITAPDGSSTTLQSFQGSTAPVAVHTAGLSPNANIVIGTQGADGATPTVAGQLDTEVVVRQSDGKGNILSQTHLGRIRGTGLANLSAAEAFVGVIDPTSGKWVEGTKRSLTELIGDTAGAPATGPYSPLLILDPREIKENQDYKITADKRQLGQMAATMQTTEDLLVKTGVTHLYVEGAQVDSSPWSAGPARYKGRAKEGQKTIPVTAAYGFVEGAESAAAVDAAYQALRKQVADSKDSLMPGLTERLLRNVDRGRSQMMKLVSP